MVLPVNADVAAEILRAAPLRGLNLTLLKKPEERSFTIEKIDRMEQSSYLPTEFSVGMILYRVWGIRPPESNTVPSQETSSGEDGESALPVQEGSAKGLGDQGPQ